MSYYIIDAMMLVFFSCFNAVIKILNQIYDWENSIFFKRIVLKKHIINSKEAPK